MGYSSLVIINHHMKRFVSSFPIISTFCQVPYCEHLSQLTPDTQAAILGIPWDEGVGFIPGQRLAPKQIRDYSARLRLPEDGFFSIEDGRGLLRKVKIVDLGDVGVFKTLPQKTFANISETIKEIVSKNIVPIILGGDHSITYPIIKGFAQYERLGIIQIDAHLDFNVGREGIVLGNENCIRRVSELPFISSITQIGIRGLLPVEESFVAAQKRGNVIITIQDIKNRGLSAVLKKIQPLNVKNFYITLDIDALDPGIAPGTSTREPGGLTYEEVKQLLQDLTKFYNIVGLDLVEVNPLVDASGLTAILATRLILEFCFDCFDRNKKGAI